jgi:hypothetical protein
MDDGSEPARQMANNEPKKHTHISDKNLRVKWTACDAQTFQELYTQTVSVEVLEIGTAAAAMRA